MSDSTKKLELTTAGELYWNHSSEIQPTVGINYNVLEPVGWNQGSDGFQAMDVRIGMESKYFSSPSLSGDKRINGEALQVVLEPRISFETLGHLQYGLQIRTGALFADGTTTSVSGFRARVGLPIPGIEQLIVAGAFGFDVLKMNGLEEGTQDVSSLQLAWQF